jgi:sucrose-6-phosphate hydrolase SacC (GH32 family)
MQSIPRELKLRQYADGVRLVQSPVHELASLEGEIVSASGNLSAINSKLRSAKLSRFARVTATVRPGSATRVELRLLKSGSEETLVGLDTREKTIYVDRTRSGENGFSKDFAGTHAAPLENTKEVKLDIFIDQTSLEIFVNDGERVLSERVFPLQQGDFKLELFATGAEAGNQSVRIARMKSVWE